MIQYEYKEEYKYLTNAVLNVTDDCNLACRYCFVKQKPKYMSLQTGIDIIEYLQTNLKKKNELGFNDNKNEITFFGGEPLLNYEKLIKPLILYTNEKQYKINYSITDNGTLLTPDKIDFFKKYHVGILLSIDGNKDTQDFNRPCKDGSSSFDKIIQNIPHLLQQFPDTTFRSTVYAPTVDKLFENYLFVEKLGFKKFAFMPDLTSIEWTQDQLENLNKQLDLIFKYRLLQFQNKQKPLNVNKIDQSFKLILDLIIRDSDFSLKKMDQEPFMRCGLGTGLGSIGYDGKIYACQEWATKSEESPYYIGDIYHGIDQQLHERVLKMYYDALVYGFTNNKNTCNQKDCKIYEICKNLIEPRGFCPSWNYNNFKTFKIREINGCYYDNLFIQKALATFELLIKEDNEFFKEYLQNLTKTYMEREFKLANRERKKINGTNMDR